MNRRQLFACILLSASIPACNSGAADKPKPKAKPYPLETCIISGEKLGSMGKPVVFEYKEQEIKLCCKSCRAKFDKDADTFLKKIQDGGKKN